MKNGLYIVATPIGNLSDISERAKTILETAEVIACEDTRVTKKLFSLLGLDAKKHFLSLHNFNEEEVSDKVIDIIHNEGKSVALVSDAGSPLISDPGYKLIRKCHDRDVYVSAAPGPCALIVALQLSGLPSDRFMFAGFIPNKEKARKDCLENLKNIPATLIFYETAPRILKTLEAAKEVFGNRDMSVVREISKIYEEYVTGKADEIIEKFENQNPRGEIVFLVSPPLEEKLEEIDIRDILKKYLSENTLKDAVKKASEDYGLSKKEVYNIALELKDEK